MSNFSDVFLDHFLNPKNVGEISNPDSIGVAENKERGGKVVFYMSLIGNRINEIKYKVLGCPAAISAASVISERCLNMDVLEAKNLSDKKLKEWLGEIPDNVFECAKLALQAFHNAILNFLERRKK